MSFLKDIAYGFGASKEKPPGYDQRTADSIQATRGREAADTYRESKGIDVAESDPPKELVSYGAEPSFVRDAMLDRRIGAKNFMNFGNPLEPFGEGDDRVTQEMIDAYNQRTAFAKNRADQNFMGTGLTQQEYARGQQYGFSTGSDGKLTAQDKYGPEPTITDPNAPDATDPESTTFNPNNAFLRNRMRMQQEQGGGIMPFPYTGEEPPFTGGPYIPPPNFGPPQTPGLPPIDLLPRPRPQMPPQLQGIMQLQDRSNISPAMRYAAENYYRLGGRQMMNDEYDRGRRMIQGQSV